MAVVTGWRDAPFRLPVVAGGAMHREWLFWLNAIGRRLAGRTLVDAPFDPSSIAAGAVQQATLTVPGAMVSDVVIGVSFDAPQAGVLLHGQVTAAETVTVSFRNVTGAAIDLAAGTVRIMIEKAR